MFEFYVKVFEKKDGGKSAMLAVNLGYAKKVLSWDYHLCAELLNVSCSELLNKECGNYKVK